MVNVTLWNSFIYETHGFIDLLNRLDYMSDVFLTVVMLGFIIGFSVSSLVDVVCYAYILRKKANMENGLRDDEYGL